MTIENRKKKQLKSRKKLDKINKVLRKKQKYIKSSYHVEDHVRTLMFIGIIQKDI